MSGEREIRQLRKAKLRAQRAGDVPQEAAICNQLGEILASHGRYEEALEEHRQELHLLEGAGDGIGCAVAHRKIGERLAEMDNYEAALKHQRQHLELARSLGDETEQQRAWATIGRTFMFVADSRPPEEAETALREAEEAFRTSLKIVEEKLEGAVSAREVSEMRSRLYLNLGLVYDSLKEPAKCQHFIRKSIFLSEQSRLDEDLFRAHFNLGHIQLRDGDPSGALRSLARAGDCARRLSEPALESDSAAASAQVLLSLGDFAAAKRALRRALGVRQPGQRELVRASLRYATKVTRLQAALEEAGATQAALALWEQLGDTFSKQGDFGRAAQSYQKQLELAEELGRPPEEVAVIHVSLATTFGDLGDHERAVHHYRQELALHRGDPLEEARTWLNMALALAEAGESPEQLQSCLRSALQRAEAAGDTALQRRVLRHLRRVQLGAGDTAGAAETGARLQALGGGQEDQEEEEEEEGNSEEQEESDLELSDSEEDEEQPEGYKSGRRRLSKWERRNERGETPLHRACIEGDLRRVRLFLKQGHPVNPRDYCGWTPLHEACNHGHLEVVVALLEAGAALDDAGGPGCEGVTPLHDALACGHFEVAELLVRRGASLRARNSAGLTPLGTLRDWIRTYGPELDQETWQRCRATERLLREAEKTATTAATTTAPSAPPDSLFDAELSQPAPEQPGKKRQREEDEVEEDEDAGWNLGRTKAQLGGSKSNLGGSKSSFDGARSNLGGSKSNLDGARSNFGGSRSNFGGSKSNFGSIRSNLDGSRGSKSNFGSITSNPDGSKSLLGGSKSNLDGSKSLLGGSRSNFDGSEFLRGSKSNFDGSKSQFGGSRFNLDGSRSNLGGSKSNPGGSISFLDGSKSLGGSKSNLDGSRSLPGGSKSNPDGAGSNLDGARSNLDGSKSLPGGSKSNLDGSRFLLGGSESNFEDSESILDDSDSLLSASEAVSGAVPTASCRLRALIPEEEYLAQEDWLEDDLGSCRGSWKRPRWGHGDTGTTWRDVGMTSRANSEPEKVTRRRRSRLSRSWRRRMPEQEGARSPCPSEGDTEGTAELTVTSGPAVTPNPVPTLRVRVRIQDSVFLIPVPQSEPCAVGWLAERAAERYQQALGLLPRLTLKKEGALLAPQDAVRDVLRSNEEVLAEVQGWDLPPLAERYRRACRSLDVEPHRLLLKVTERQDQSPELSFGAGLGVTAPHLPPLLRALKLQGSLRRLRLGSCGISDAVAPELAAALATLPALGLLDLSGNRLGAQGLRHLLPPDPGPDGTFQSLEELDLSLNPLGDSSCRPLARLLQACPALKTLRLEACGFSHDFDLPGASRLQFLTLSRNSLGSSALERLLGNLSPRTLSRLELGAVVPPASRILLGSFRNFLEQEGNVLSHLSLAGNRLEDRDVLEVARSLLACPSLVSLDLSANPGVTSRGFRMLLSALERRPEGLHFLDLSGCSVDEGPWEASPWPRSLSQIRRFRLSGRRGLLGGPSRPRPPRSAPPALGEEEEALEPPPPPPPGPFGSH